ncbi:MAG: acyl-CoA dehydrogenase [Dehalococcoidia bacterium]|nr:acyl-CoA dehydrogenase [Dehalococcoidia bacterium]
MPESLHPDLVALRDRIRAFVEDDLSPLERGLDPDAAVPADVRQRVRERSRELGLFGMTQPQEFGGSEAGPLAMAVARETVAAGNCSLGRYVFGPGRGMLAHAEGDLRTRYLEPVMRGEAQGAFAFTEPSGPDASDRATWAKRDGDVFLVSGRKAFVSGGATADFYQVLVNVEEDASGPGGTAMLFIDRGTLGVTIERAFESLDGGGHVELRFEGARVPQLNVLGKIGEGMPRAMGNINEERVESAATACGLALWTVDYVTHHITQGHRGGSRLGDREGVRLRYSDLRIETYAARAMLYRTARLLEAGEDAMNEAAAAKVFCTEVIGRVVDSAVQLVGGQALIVGHPLERLYRRVRSMRLAAGANDILRLNVARGVIEFNAGRL